MKVNLKDWKIIWYFFREHKWQSLGVLLFMFVSGSLEMLNLAALYPVINYGLHVNKQSQLMDQYEKVIRYIAPDNRFLASCIFLIMISVIALIFKFIYHYASNKLMVRVVGDAQKRVFDRFASANYGFYVKNQQGKLIYVGTMATEKVQTLLNSMITWGYNVVNAIFLFAFLAFLSWPITCVIIGVGIFYGVVIKKIMGKYIKKCASICLEERERRNVILNEFIGGFKTIKVFLSIPAWQDRYVRSVDRGLINRFRMFVARAIPEPFVKFLFFMLIAITGITLSFRSRNDIIALLPLLGTFAVVVNRFLPSIHKIGNGFIKLAELVPDMHVVYNICHQDFPQEQEGPQAQDHFQKEIRFEEVRFRYPRMDKDLLQDVSFSIEHKKMTALVGPSGAGKTTIINILLKLYRPNQGRVTMDGVDIFDLNNASYLARIGYVSQETFIFNNTIKENIRFGMENCTEQMIEEAAKLANAHEFIVKTEKGYNTRVGDSGIKLSGGQRQRIAIARAMLRKPEIIVFDEATSSLDNISEKRIQIAIGNISKHTTVLVVAHRLSTVKQADKIIILDKGKIKEQGTHDELLKNKDVYYHLHMAKDIEQKESKEFVKKR